MKTDASTSIRVVYVRVYLLLLEEITVSQKKFLLANHLTVYFNINYSQAVLLMIIPVTRMWSMCIRIKGNVGLM